mmetsp:Transcript_45704/g.143452  ORF Transcript_45704/g.143452 Transcript_45704/m.143452 type:complete len:85 (-) Transcript_45704:613-867(-)
MLLKHKGCGAVCSIELRPVLESCVLFPPLQSFVGLHSFLQVCILFFRNLLPISKQPFPPQLQGYDEYSHLSTPATSYLCHVSQW